MNTVTKMILISEDQYNRKCTEDKSELLPLLNSNLSDDLKIRFVNEVLKRKGQKIILPEPIETKIISQPIPEPVNESISEPVIEPTVEPTIEPVNEQSNDLNDDEDDYQSFSSNVSETWTTKATRLKLLLNKIPGLINSNGQVVENKKPYARSDIDDVIRYITSRNDPTRAPPGAKYVISKMISDPQLRSYIRNEKIDLIVPAKKVVTWLQASALRNTSTQKKAGP